MQTNKTIMDSKKQGGRWLDEEHERFMLGLMQYGKNWKKIQEIVATRSGSQVRSHAQKFFNKIQKNAQQSNSKKSQKISQHELVDNDEDASFTQNNDLVRSINDENSLSTPVQIIALIKKESQSNKRVNLSSFKKTLQNEQKQTKNANVSNQTFNNLIGKKGQSLQENIVPFKLNSFKSMNNIISAYEALNQTDPENRYQDQSFLIGITKKYKKYFSKGGKFQNLIDFGNPFQVKQVVLKANQIHNSQRKKSWTFVDGFEGDQRQLEDIKQKIKQYRPLNSNEPSKTITQGKQIQQKTKSQAKINNF